MTAFCEVEQHEDRGYMSKALFTPREGNPGVRVTLALAYFFFFSHDVFTRQVGLP